MSQPPIMLQARLIIHVFPLPFHSATLLLILEAIREFLARQERVVTGRLSMPDAAMSIVPNFPATLLVTEHWIPFCRMCNVKAVEAQTIEVLLGDFNRIIDDLLKISGTRATLMGFRLILEGP